MKAIPSLFLISLLLLVSTVLAQEHFNNFQNDESALSWQKVYPTAFTFEQLCGKFKDSGLLENIDVRDNKITGDLKPLEADFKGAGFSEMSTPMYIARSYFTGFVKVDYQEGKYRVTIKKVMLSQKYDDPLTKQGEKSTLESWGLKKGNQIRDSFKKSPSLILDYTYSRKFEFNGKDKSDNW